MTDVEVTGAKLEEAPVLANLLELYAHDFSEFLDLEIGEDGRFGYSHLPLYWSEPDWHPLLIRTDGKLAGLMLIKKVPGVADEGTVWDVAEFFIIRGYRRCGTGTRAAHKVWARYPGMWEVRVMEANAPALRFWAEAISTFAGKPVRPARVEKGGSIWNVFLFESRATGGDGPASAGP